MEAGTVIRQIHRQLSFSALIRIFLIASLRTEYKLEMKKVVKAKYIPSIEDETMKTENRIV